LVLADFGKLGRAYVETSETEAGREDIISNLLAGQYDHPIRVVAFNTAQGWSRDVTEEISSEVASRRECSAKA
jgi:hypothetical protein